MMTHCKSVSRAAGAAVLWLCCDAAPLWCCRMHELWLCRGISASARTARAEQSRKPSRCFPVCKLTASPSGTHTPSPPSLPPSRSVAWDEEAVQTFRRESLRVLAVTWNVGESKPEPGSPFFRWVHEAAFPTQLVVVGLQEIEMGSSSGGWGHVGRRVLCGCEG